MDRFRFNQSASEVISKAITAPNASPVPGNTLTAAILTLFDWDTGAAGGSPLPGILNGRHQQNVLNLNDVTIDESGLFTWQVQPDDNVIVTSRRQVERHRAIFLFMWADGQFPYECEIEVVNLGLAS